MDENQLRNIVFSNSRTIEAILARQSAQQNELETLLDIIRALSSARDFEEQRQQLDADIRSLLQEILEEIRRDSR